LLTDKIINRNNKLVSAKLSYSKNKSATFI